jgi:transcriptional regulator NrdR family protein
MDEMLCCICGERETTHRLAKTCGGVCLRKRKNRVEYERAKLNKPYMARQAKRRLDRKFFRYWNDPEYREGVKDKGRENARIKAQRAETALKVLESLGIKI